MEALAFSAPTQPTDVYICDKCGHLISRTIMTNCTLLALKLEMLLTVFRLTLPDRRHHCHRRRRRDTDAQFNSTRQSVRVKV